MPSFWNISPSMLHLPELDALCSSSSLSWLSNWLEAFVGGRDTRERRGSLPPKIMQSLCTTCLVIKKWSFGDEKKPVSTAQIMDKRPHPDVPLKPPMAVTGVEWTCAAIVASYSITQRIATYSHLYATLKYNIWYCYSPPMDIHSPPVAIHSPSSSYPSPSHFLVYTIGFYKENYG